MHAIQDVYYVQLSFIFNIMHTKKLKSRKVTCNHREFQTKTFSQRFQTKESYHLLMSLV